MLVAVRGAKLLPSGGGEGQHLLYAVVGLAIAVAAFAGNAVLPLLAIIVVGGLAVAYRDSEGPERGGFLCAGGSYCWERSRFMLGSRGMNEIVRVSK